MSETKESGRSRSPEEHRERMARRKTVVDRRIAAARTDKGVLVVLSGSGKGKSSSAFGMAVRALGHGLRVAIVQFIKGRTATGEQAFFRRLPDVEFHVMGEGFTWETQDRDRDRAAAEAAWARACDLLRDPARDLVILDELNIVLRHGTLGLDAVLDALRERPPRQHVVVTGRGAPHALIDLADTVSEVRLVKHAFAAGVRAQKGIEL